MPKNEVFDLIIVGGSAAATAAGIYAARRNLNFKIVAKDFGGEVATSGEIGNWPGINQTDGIALARQFREHLEFYKVQIEEGARGALILTLETILLSMVSFFIVNGTFFRSFLLAYPEIIFLSLIVNILIGKWTGLRLWEYYRFREVIEAIHLKRRKSS